MNIEEQRIRRKVKLKEIGSLAKEARQQDNIEVRELSSKTGYTTQLIYAFENGHSSNMVILFDCYFCILTEKTQMKLYPLPLMHRKQKNTPSLPPSAATWF